MRGHPRYNPGEFTTVDLLREKDVDAAFVMCSDLLSQIPPECAAYLAEIPLICLDTIPCPTTAISDIVLPGVIDAMRDRRLRSGEIYELPEAQISPLKVQVSDLMKEFSISTADIVRTVATRFNLGGVLAEEICARAGIDKSKPSKEATEEDASKLCNAMIETALGGNFRAARKELNRLLYEEGLSGEDIIGQIYRAISEMDNQVILDLGLSEKRIVELVDIIGEIDFRLTEGATEKIQLEALLAHFALSNTD